MYSDLYRHYHNFGLSLGSSFLLTVGLSSLTGPCFFPNRYLKRVGKVTVKRFFIGKTKARANHGVMNNETKTRTGNDACLLLVYF